MRPDVATVILPARRTRDEADFYVAATEYVVILVSIWINGHLAENGQERPVMTAARLSNPNSQHILTTHINFRKPK